jgi:peptide methionine sulfoxide reductase MsrA/rhodanese-related sulfurtransferase
MYLTITVLVLIVLFSLAIFVVPVSAATQEKLIYFAGGCFWGTEHMMGMVPGVISAVSGYANGTVQNPNYQQVVTGQGLYFSSIDPTVKNRQGNDIGTQYQTGVYFTSKEDGAVVKATAEIEKSKHPAFFVEIAPLTAFWDAEEYHQDYLVKNPGGYCHIGQEEFERARNTGKKPATLKAEYRVIKPADAKAAIDAGLKPIIVDVREPSEFSAGHIPGAINLPLGSLVQLAKNQLPDKDALIYLYCRSGSRSQSGAQQLVREGYTRLYDLGGIINWPYDVVK